MVVAQTLPALSIATPFAAAVVLVGVPELDEIAIPVDVRWLTVPLLFAVQTVLFPSIAMSAGEETPGNAVAS